MFVLLLQAIVSAAQKHRFSRVETRRQETAEISDRFTAIFSKSFPVPRGG